MIETNGLEDDKTDQHKKSKQRFMSIMIGMAHKSNVPDLLLKCTRAYYNAKHFLSVCSRAPYTRFYAFSTSPWSLDSSDLSLLYLYAISTVRLLYSQTSCKILVFKNDNKIKFLMLLG